MQTLFALMLLFIYTRLFITAVSMQAAGFERAHGRITERNRSAVLMKWGHPHEQQELRVEQTRKRT